MFERLFSPQNVPTNRAVRNESEPLSKSAAGVRSFDLNIEKILEGWEVRHAIRELIANALDEQALTGTKDIEILERKGTWFIRDFGRGLRYEHFTQNENEEKLANSEKVIGKFGVGLKDALATLNRRGVNVRISSKYGNVTLDQQSKHGFADVVTLHALISPSDNSSFVGTEIALDGVSRADVIAAKSFFLAFSNEGELERTRYGIILKKESGRNARIYVTGLLVAEEENFAFSYNITALTKRMRNALNRERTNVGRTAYSDRVKEMLLEARTSAVANALASELAKIELGTCADEVKWTDVAKHAVRILNASERVMFVSASEIMAHGDVLDRAKAEGVRIVTIPDNIKEGIRGLQDIAGTVVRDISVYQEEWRQSFKFVFVEPKSLRPRERAVYDQWRAIADLAGGVPSVVREIKITETMRPDLLSIDHTAGLWDPALAYIIIKRDQLSSLETFAGTLLHEIVHADSGHGDITRDFEIALTSMLGRIAADRLRS